MAIPHLAIPVRFTTITGRVAAAVNEQDGYDEVYDCVQTVARFTKGDIEDELDFGVTDQTFIPIMNIDLLRQELVDGEPRMLSQFSTQPDPTDSMIQRVLIDVYSSVEGT
jgi:hypothetical protein